MADADVFLEKAQENLGSARSDFEAGRFNASARSSYYSTLQAGISALLSAGVAPTGQWGYRFVQGRFSGILVGRRKLFEARWSSAISNNREVRAEADYSPIRISSRRARQALDRAGGLVSAVKGQGDGRS
jgi:uncharacterized protein (UPF0332 family)